MKPYIICHMIASLDGRIDCAMVDKISGDEYYSTLAQLDCPSGLEGKVTMEHYNALEGTFIPKVNEPVGAEKVYVAQASDAYIVSVDTKGTLQWAGSDIDGRPLVCIVSEQASKEYLAYLEGLGISYIAVGKDKIDMVRAMDILGEQFGVKRLAVLGGGNINGGFVEAGLLDEISLLVAAGIDGRKGMTAVFDGIEDMSRQPVPLKLKSAEALPNGTVWLRYLTK